MWRCGAARAGADEDFFFFFYSVSLASMVYLALTLVDYQRRGRRIWLWRLVDRQSGRCVALEAGERLRRDSVLIPRLALQVDRGKVSGYKRFHLLASH